MIESHGAGSNAPEDKQRPSEAAHPPPIVLLNVHDPAGAATAPQSLIIWNMVEQELQARNLSLQQVSRETLINPKTFSRYRDGRTARVRDDVLQRLCVYFDWGEPAFVRRWGMSWRTWFEETTPDRLRQPPASQQSSGDDESGQARE
jgi:hypothetical protein